MKCSTRKRILAVLFITCVLVEPILARRSGGGFGRGSSAGRSSGGGFGSRGSSASRTGTGGGGYHHNTGGSSYPRGNYGVGGGHSSGGGGFFGGNRQSNQRGTYSGGGHNSGGGGFFGGSRPQQSHKFTKGSGIGSVVRSNSFKNAMLGAAAGMLLYQGGKYLIRSAMSPMHWGGRSYYWGQNYYQPRPNMQMCRMPVDPNDQQFGNVYFQDQTRPREITWGCEYGTVCCGYECCPSSSFGGQSNYGSSYNGYGNNGFFGRNSAGRNFGFGSLLLLLLISSCACFVVYRMCNRNGNTYRRANNDQPPAYAY